MSHKKVYISEVFENKITLSNGSTSSVVEYIPEDCGQKDEMELAGYLSRFHQYLLNYQQEKFKFNTIRFSSLDGKFFLNADSSFCESFPLKKEPSNSYMGYFFGSSFDSKNTHELSIINKDDYVKINGAYFRVLSLYPNFPEQISPNYLSIIGDFIVHFKKTNKENAVRQMEFKRNIFNGARYKEKRDVEGNSAYYEAETFLENLKNGSEAHFSCEVFLVIKAMSEEELYLKTENLTRFLSSTSLSFIIEQESLTEIIPSLIFGMEALFKRSIPVDSSYLLNLLPMTSEYIHDYGSKFTSIDNLESTVSIDIFDRGSHNYNAIAIGPSGNGKSWLVQKLCRDLLSRGVGGIIFDLGESHLKYCLYYNAKVFTSKFNPMQFRDPSYLHALILSMIPDGEISFKEKGAILKSIKQALTEDINTFSGLISYIESQGLKEFSLYFEELFPFITEEITPIERLVYIDTGAYPDSIKAPLIIFLFEYFEHIEGKKVFVFDECWKFLRTVGWFIEERFRTLRKKNASAIAISQGFDEFFSTEIGKAVIENCFHKFIFQQTIKKNEILTEFDITAASRINSKKGSYSEFYYKSANHKKRLRCYGSEWEKELFTSEADDNHRLETFFKTLGADQAFKTLFDTYMKTFHPGVEEC